MTNEIFIELDLGRCRSCKNFMCEPPNNSSKYVIECAIGRNLFIFKCDGWARGSFSKTQYDELINDLPKLSLEKEGEIK